MNILPETDLQPDDKQREQTVQRQACAQLHIALEGRATNIINGKESQVRPLDVFVLTRDMTHAQPEAWRYRYCRFTFRIDRLQTCAGQLLAEPAFQALFALEPVLRRRGFSEANLQIDALTAEYAVKTARLLAAEQDQTLCDTLFFALIAAICKKARPRLGGQAAHGLIAEAAAYMEGHYAEPLDLETLAGQTHYSKRHFARLFREYYQMSPMDYLNRVRLRHATALLPASAMSLTEIAEFCGFADGGLFSKHFRRRYGVSPSAYRKNQKPDFEAQPLLQSAAVIMPEPSQY